MIRNYFKLALRSLKHDRGYALINIVALAVFIACLRLFGLSSFTIQRRAKEIGVRKVLGASVPGIILLLSRDFVQLVALAFVLAGPIAYLVMDRWLESFAYRTTVGVGIFLLTGGLALMIALSTVSYQSVRAAMRNPVEALRYE